MPSMMPKLSPSRRQYNDFLNLPPEIRVQIYQYCLIRKGPIKLQYLLIDEHRFTVQGIHDENKSLLLVSRLVGSEAVGVLYGENVFEVHLCGGEYFLRKYITEANRRRIRKMLIVLRSQGITYGRMPDSALWSPILTTLRKLSIVAQQPLPARRYVNAQMYYNVTPNQQSMDDWMVWLSPILRYIARRVTRSCIIEVDDDDRSETNALMSKCFPKCYRKVQTLAGDLCFLRNKFFRDSM